MANLKFLMGLYQSLDNAAIAEGQILITKDTREMFVDVDASTRIKIGDFTVVATIAQLEALDATKVPTSRLYYVEDGNILARSNGTAWIQVNKQKSASELKEFLGLGSMAYKSNVAESDLTAELAEKVNAAAEGNHSHTNKGVLDGITAEKVAAWDSAEADAIAHANGLNTAMNSRVEALEAIDHEHANKALLDTYTQTEADLADAVAKKHAHTFNEAELNKIVDGDVAKWNGVAADHLTSADKTTLENSIKDAKKAGTDANTNIETYKVSNDARVKAVEDDITEITAAEGGILAQAKSYSDGKLATARTEITAEIDADVKVVNDAFEAYKTSNDSALAGVKATAEAAAVKTEVESALAGKVDKVEGKSLISDSEITRLAGVHNYDDTQVKADIAKKADAEAMTTELGKKVDKVDGYSLVSDDEIARLAEVDNYDDTAVTGAIASIEETLAGKSDEGHGHEMIDINGLEDALAGKSDDGHGHEMIDINGLEDALAGKADEGHGHEMADINGLDDALLGKADEGHGHEIADVNGLQEALDEKALASDLSGLSDTVSGISEFIGELPESTEAETIVAYIDAKTANIASDETVGAIDERVQAIEDDYLKAADKTELEGKITAEETRAKGVEEGLQNQINLIMNNPDTKDVIDSIAEFTQYVADHGTIADGFRTDIDKNKEDIAANAKAIEDHEALAAETYETKADATAKKTEIDGRLDTLEGKVDVEKVSTAISSAVAVETGRATAAEEALAGRVKDLEDNKAGYATTTQVATAKQEAIDAAAGDAASKYEAIGVAQTKVDALANGQVKANAEAIATKANAADVYAKAETFTKDEVTALIEQAHTWGSF